MQTTHDPDDEHRRRFKGPKVLLIVLLGIPLVTAGGCFYRIAKNVYDLKEATRPIRELGGGYYTGGDGMADLNRPKAVTRVLLRETKTTDADLERLRPVLERFPDLRYIDLSYTPVSEQGLETLAPLKKLRYVILDGTKVTIEGVQRFQKLKPQWRLSHDFPEDAGNENGR